MLLNLVDLEVRNAPNNATNMYTYSDYKEDKRTIILLNNDFIQLKVIQQALDIDWHFFVILSLNLRRLIFCNLESISDTVGH